MNNILLEILIPSPPAKAFSSLGITSFTGHKATGKQAFTRSPTGLHPLDTGTAGAMEFVGADIDNIACLLLLLDHGTTGGACTCRIINPHTGLYIMSYYTEADTCSSILHGPALHEQRSGQELLTMV